MSKPAASLAAPSLAVQPVHLGLGATVCAQPPFTGMAWYGDYIARHGADGNEGRLVTRHSFAQSWDHWEMHPHGEELVLCLAGALMLHQETATGQRTTQRLEAGQYAINPAGVWHTADMLPGATDAADMLFITAGMGTQHRSR